MTKIVEVSELRKKYKKSKEYAVDGVSFSVEEGEFVTMLGPNGAGKTTTISILTTTLQKTSGKVSVAGFDVDKQQNEVRKNIGIVFQNPSLDLNLTAEENIRFHACLYGLHSFRPVFSWMSKDYQDRVLQLAEVVGIKKELHLPVKNFSGGMKRKLEIVRSLMHNPRVLFLDEPTVGLDPVSRKNVWKYLKEVRRETKTTIFLTTHYLDEAEETDRVFVVNKGKLVARGTPMDLKQKLVKEYVELDSKDRESLEKELKRLKIEYIKDGRIKARVSNGGVQRLIKGLKTELSLVRTHTPTLEEAYLEIVEKDND